MDPVSFSIAVVSIASVFQTCVHGYRSLSRVVTMGDSAVTLGIRFRVEEKRLLLWGRYWGLIKDPRPNPKTTDLDSDSDEVSDEEGEPGSDEESLALIDSVDEDLEIPGLRNLTIDILGRIRKALEECKSIGEKYGVPLKEGEDGNLSTPSGRSSKDLLAKVAAKQEKQSKKISKENKLLSRLSWALKDRQDLEDLLVRLIGLNDSLDKLLPRQQRTNLERALVGEVLIIFQQSQSGVDGLDVPDQIRQLKGQDETKAARIILLKNSNDTESSERDLKPDLPADSYEPIRPNPFAKSSVWVEGTPGNMHIPFIHFVRLTEPKLMDYQISGTSGEWRTGKYAPLPRSLGVYSPARASTASPSELADASDKPAQATLIEWRPATHESNFSELSEKGLNERRDHIARLLHRTSTTDDEFRVLDCLGYTTASGHTADGSAHDLVGYVYKYPEFADPKSLPISLRMVLNNAYKSNNPKVPSLDDRFKLARNLAIALYQLQCAGWVHRKLSSYNVIFFKDSVTGNLNLGRPYLTGWQYSRPDDQRRIYASENCLEGVGDLDMYVHRRRLLAEDDKLPRFRKSFDIYSLGIILMEIAFWEPIVALTNEKERSQMEQNVSISSGWRSQDWWKMISATAKEELASEMGVAYRDAVLFCLYGGMASKKERNSTFDEGYSEDRYYPDDDFHEVGIEKQLYWRVVKSLEKFGM